MGVNGKSLKVIRWGITGALILLGGSLIWVVSESLAARLFYRFRPDLERELSKPLGHPIVIGPYKGLRLWGVAIGSTELTVGERDSSTASFSSLTVKYAPIASLFHWRPVVLVRPKGTKFNLRPNSDGVYWVSGATKETPPNVALWLRLNDPAKVFIHPSKTELSVSTNSFLKLREKNLIGSIQLGLPGRGTLHLKGRGYLDHLELQARARLKRVKLEPIDNLLLDKFDLNAKGQLDGDLQVSVKQGALACTGGLTLVDFLLEGDSLTRELSSKKATISCSKDSILFPSTQWKYGPWISSITGEIPLKKEGMLDLLVNSSIGLKSVSSSRLNVAAKLPFEFTPKGLSFGELFADVNLKPFPLSPIGSIIGTPLAGTLAAKGEIVGPITALQPNLQIGIVNPQASQLRLQEEWRGDLLGRPDGGAKLSMASVRAPVPGSLSASFNRNWLLDNLTINRLGGQISVDRTQDRFTWEAQDFRLDRVEVAINPEQSFKRIFGKLKGEGSFQMDPVAFDGEMKILFPRYMGLRFKEVFVKGSFLDNEFNLSGMITPPDDKGQLALNADGLIGGRLNFRGEALGVSARWITDTALQLPKINLKATSARGEAEDLGGFFVRAFGDSLDGRLNALAYSQASLLKESDIMSTNSKSINPNDIQGDINAVIEVKGPDINKLSLDLELSGQLWPKGKRTQVDFKGKPFVAIIRGPLQGGVGQFSLLNVPFSLLSLIAPLPSSLSGMVGISGQYRRGSDISEITAELILEDARLATKTFVLDRGDIKFSNSNLEMDIMLRSTSSVQPIKLVGNLPLDPSSTIDFRVETHGDGLQFLDGLFDGALSWNDGTADLRFLIRGTRKNPEANGFLVLREGEFVVMEKVIKDLKASLVFDFNRVEVLNFEAITDRNGTLKGFGSIGLFRPEEEERQPLMIEMKNVPFKLPFAAFEVAADLKLKGALLQPQIGGNLTIKDGAISPPEQTVARRNNSTRVDDGRSSWSSSQKRTSFPEQKWDMQTPLDLFVQDSDSTASRILSSSIPSKFSNISFDKLRLFLGPDLQIATPPNAFTRQPLAIFDASGLLTLNGALDKTLNASGVVRLIKGRVNLFTTTFTLDRSKPNVAVFAPSMGLIPYVDVTMTTSVSDTVRSGDNLTSSSDFSTNGSGAFGIGGSRLIKVEVVATGPADRISDNFQLSSRPTMPRNQLIGLLGGNSLTSLFDGGETAVLGNVIGRSFLSPLLGNVSDSLSDRLQVSLYPTTIVSSPKGSSDDKRNEDETTDTPQQAWVTDIGIDLNKKFNFSVQATPTRSDIPPQGTLRYAVNSNLDALGSLDQEGNWQSQLQLFLRY